jgi:hypothetical protein
MTLTNPNPVVIPAQPEQTFPHLWLSDIVVSAPSTSEGMIYIRTLPYNQGTQTIGSNNDQVILQTHDLWRAVNEVPEVAQAMGAIFQAVEPLRAWLNGGTSNVVTTPDPIEVEDVVVTETDPIEVEDVVVDEIIEG